MLSKDESQIKAVRELSAYKVKFFGNDVIPMKELDVDEFNKHYRFSKHNSPNFCLLFGNSHKNL